jgi:hypothetical protein
VHCLSLPRTPQHLQQQRTSQQRCLDDTRRELESGCSALLCTALHCTAKQSVPSFLALRPNFRCARARFAACACVVWRCGAACRGTSGVVSRRAATLKTA